MVTPLNGLGPSRIGNWLILLSEKMVFSIIKLTKGKERARKKGKGMIVAKWKRGLKW